MMKRITDQVLVFVAAAAATAALIAAGGCMREAGTENPSGSQSEAIASKESTTPYYRGLIEEYQSLLAEDPNNLAAIIALGNALYDAGKWKGAIQYYERALQIDPHSTDVMTDMGTCYRNMGMPDKAIEIYKRAVSIEPSHQNALYNLGIVYGQDKKDYRKAIQYLDQLLHVAPKHPQADNIKAALHAYKQGHRKVP